MFLKLFISFLLLSATYSQTISINSEKIELYLENAVQNEHFSGVVMVAHNNKILLNRGYGMATDSVKNSSETVVHVASITKQFTAAAIMLLKEQKLIDLNTPINSYLPTKYQSEKWERVMVHHLLSHTGGIPDYAVERDYYDVRKGFCFGNTVDGMINEAREKPLKFEPGSSFEYSNIGYTILGLIIEKQAKTSYREFIKHNILKRAGMCSSDIHDESYIEGAAHATGYRWNEQQKKLVQDDEISLPATPPDGGLLTTTSDLFKWSNMLVLKTKGILSSGSIKEMATPNKNTSCCYGEYGYGLFIDSFLGTKRIHHPGWIVGFRSHFCLFPEKQIFVFVFCNNTAADPMEISKKISEIILSQ